MSYTTMNDIQNLRVSSVGKNNKSSRKQNLFDGNEDTCWSSDKGSPQWISFEFKEARTISSFTIQFQGGFVGTGCQAEFSHYDLTTLPFYPDDVNSIQTFTLAKPVVCKQVKFIFEGSTDFFEMIKTFPSEPVFWELIQDLEFP